MQNMNTPTNRCQHRAGNSQRLDVLRAWKKETPDRAEVKPWQIVGAHFGRIEAAANVQAIAHGVGSDGFVPVEIANEHSAAALPGSVRAGERPNGTLEISNNAAERAIRPLALGRKNYLFAGSDAGGEVSVIMQNDLGIHDGSFGRPASLIF